MSKEENQVEEGSYSDDGLKENAVAFLNGISSLQRSPQEEITLNIHTSMDRIK